MILLIVVIVFNFYTFQVKSSLALSAGTVLLLKALLAAGVIAVSGVAINSITQDMVDMTDEFNSWLETLPTAPEPGEPKKPPSGWENLVFKSMLGASVAYTFFDLVKSARNWLVNKGSNIGENNFDYFLDDNLVYFSNEFNSSFIINEYENFNYYLRFMDSLGKISLIKITWQRKPYNSKLIVDIGSDVYTDTSSNAYPPFWQYIYYSPKSNFTGYLKISDGTSLSVTIPQNILADIETGISINDFNYNISDDSYFSTGDENDITKVYPNLDNQLYKTYDDLDDLFNHWKNSIDDSYRINPNFPPQVNPSPDGEGVQVQPGDIDLTVPDDAEIDFSPLLNTGIVFSRKFPFSIPWDLKNSIEVFQTSAEAPVFILPFGQMPLVGGEDVEIDFSQFEKLALIVRWGLLIIFNVGLILITRKIIRG